MKYVNKSTSYKQFSLIMSILFKITKYETFSYKSNIIFALIRLLLFVAI
jgi:hypothetical protein